MLSPSCYLLQLLLLCVFISIFSAMAASTAPGLYVFGDSLLDNGNNNLLMTEARVNYRPYGIDFHDGPTGRFTNGRTVADFIADYLGLPYPPPIIGLPKPAWFTGFNYASGACGILNQTGTSRGKCLNLEKQIDLFEKTIEKMIKKGYMNTQDASFHLSESIFIFSTGTNDYINTYLDPKRIMTLLYTPKQFSQLLIDNLSLKLQRLYKLGARKVVFFELGPVGCMPNQAKTTKHNGLCNESLNWMVSHFNYGLRNLLSNLSSTLPESHFILAKDVNGLSYDAIIHPSKYGLSNGKDSCCRAWGNNTITCIPELRPRRNCKQHFFWDGYHPTEVVCELIASQCFNGSSLCVPLNIQQLLQV